MRRVEIFWPGEPCPECDRAVLHYDEGERQTRDHPGYPPNCFCPECGFVGDVDRDYVDGDM